MNSNYRISIESFRIAGLGDLFSALERGLGSVGVDFYIVGAFARDIWFNVHEIRERRATKDIDLAVWITDEQQFSDLKAYLIGHEGFAETRANAFTLIYRNGVQVDLLPFGTIEQEDRTVRFDGLGLTTISTQGLAEAYHASQPVQLDQDKTFKVCTLPGLVILKLIAWQDRPDVRPKDAQDVGYILEKYFDIAEDEIYNHHNDLFEENTDLVEIGARVMGRQIGNMLSDAPQVRERITLLLTEQTGDPRNSRLGEAMARGTALLPAEAVHRLEQVLRGIGDSRK
jgi:predicted nucleotidyltransferase